VCISLYDDKISIYPGVSQIYTPPSLSPSPLSLYLRTPPAVVQSISVIPVSPYTPRRLPPAKLSGGGGEKRIFPPQRQVLEVERDSGPDAGAPLPPLQPVERRAECALESDAVGEGVESWQMPTRAGL